MKSRIVVAGVLSIFLALNLAGCLSSARLTTPPAQTKDFFALVQTGSPQDVQDAISKGADIEARGEAVRTPLMYATWKNRNLEVIAVLLKAGADVNAQDGNGMTPLMFAGHRSSPEAINLLLKAGADLEARDFLGETALIRAAVSILNPAAIITTLVKAGADIEAQDNNGQTPLIRAVLDNPSADEVIPVLLKAGADAKAKDSAGKTAFDYAQETKNKYLKGTDAYRQLQEASQ